ncbi:hypothetical protein [Cardinium endosymbiont of Dermatophagoides farinae]|nr:hypothetical protein [Cardinium endosymbiont of Dermatophagoides farinae]
MRHTFATLALQKGISLASVQKILGRTMLINKFFVTKIFYL